MRGLTPPLPRRKGKKMNNITDRQKAIAFFERLAFVERIREAETEILQNTLEILRMCLSEENYKVKTIKEELLYRLRSSI